MILTEFQVCSDCEALSESQEYTELLIIQQ
jgi:hypothetical protein